MQKSQCKHTYFCWICGHAVDLETCKSDEHGMAVHENCYVLKVALTKESKRLMVRKPAQRVTALWYLLSASGTRRSAI
jgi:hypothetical protein